MTFYPFARAEDLNGVSVARVTIPDHIPEFKIILAHYLRANPDIPRDLIFEGRDSLAVAGSVSAALNRRYLRWWPSAYRHRTWEHFYSWPIRPHGPSPDQLYWFGWDIMMWLTSPQTVAVLGISLITAIVSVLFAWLLSYALYRWAK